MIFRPAARYPADPRAVFILALSVFSGFTALLLQVAPDSLEALLPRWAVVTWAISLAGGSLVTLVGMLRHTVGGIIAEQVGCVMVGVAAIFYSILALVEVGPTAIQTVGIIFAWGLACLIRWVQLQVLLVDGHRRAEKRKVVDAFEAAIVARQERRQRLTPEQDEYLRQWRGDSK